MIAAGCIGRIIGAMRAHAARPGLQEAGTQALLSLCSRKPALGSTRCRHEVSLALALALVQITVVVSVIEYADIGLNRSALIQRHAPLCVRPGGRRWCGWLSAPPVPQQVSTLDPKP
jgi:hypothetical protein